MIRGIKMHLFFVCQVSDPDVCQLRLDFADFHLSGPSLLTSPFGHCLHDRMAIFSSRTQNLGLSGGNLLCGDMKGQHSKLFCIDFATEQRNYVDINTKGEICMQNSPPTLKPKRISIHPNGPNQELSILISMLITMFVYILASEAFSWPFQ